ncbi:MAG TPA: hypothetical protein VGU01_05420 [Sphingomicrobium sp.]|nr:hypothetical protein [Sphingomicrobium sp.]
MNINEASGAMLQPIFDVSDAIRYVALKRGAELHQRQRAGVLDASAGESDRYEELFVNPGLIALAGARGDLDCGGFHYLAIRYGNFFQLVFRLDDGHLSVCVEKDADPVSLAQPILTACLAACAAADLCSQQEQPMPSQGAAA